MGTMSKEEILKILEDAKDKNSDVPMRLVRQAFEKLPEPCEDAVSRKDVLDGAVTNYSVSGANIVYRNAVPVEYIVSLPFVTPKLPEYEDAVSRKSILDKIKEVCFSRKQEWVDFRVSQGSNGQRDLIIKFIESLPSIHPRPNISENLNKCLEKEEE